MSVSFAEIPDRIVGSLAGRCSSAPAALSLHRLVALAWSEDVEP